MKIRQTHRFSKRAAKLIKNDEYLRRKLKEVLVKIGTDPIDKSLFTHKLKGDLEDKYSCRLTYDLRIIFKIVKENSDDIIVLLTACTYYEVY